MKTLKCLKVQNVSNECVVCGEKNPFSLFTKFFETEEDYIVGEFTAKDHHQSYPGRMHGGMISAVIDEVIGRAVQIHDPNIWGVTGELKVRYVNPTPLNEELYCFGKLTAENSRIFKGVAVLETKDGKLLATGEATYVKLPVDKIADGGLSDDDWHECRASCNSDIILHNDDKMKKLLEKE